MRLIGLAFLSASVIAISLCSERHAAGQAARMFGNAIYVMGNAYTAQVATLVDGIHDEPYLHVRYDEKYVYGDFNGDGLRDAAVIVIEDNGGQTDWYILAFLINERGTLVHRASRVLDDSAIINSVREKDRKVLMDMFVHQNGDCRAGPTKRVRNLYAYDGPDRWGEIQDSHYQRIYADGLRAFQQIYDTSIPTQIRHTLDRTQLHKSCLRNRCAFLVDGGMRISIFSKKFIIINCVSDDSGSVSATLVFEGTSQPFLVRMDNAGGGKYELRTMTEMTGLLGEGCIRQLRIPAYRRYWQ